MYKTNVGINRQLADRYFNVDIRKDDMLQALSGALVPS